MDPTRKSIQEELEQLSPKLFGMLRRNKEQAPENYFDQMQQSVLNQIAVTGRASTRTTSSFDTMFTYLQAILAPKFAVAFGLILLVGLGFFLSQDEAPTDYLANVSDAELNEFLIDEVDDEDMLAFIDDPSDIEMPVDEFIDEDILIDHVLDDMDEEDLEDLF